MMPEEVAIQEPALLVRLTKRATGVDPATLSPGELAKRTLCCWKLDAKRVAKAEYAFAVIKGAVREVYALEDSQPAWERGQGRVQLIGDLAPNAVREKYVGESVKGYFTPGSANPVRYVQV